MKDMQNSQPHPFSAASRNRIVPPAHRDSLPGTEDITRVELPNGITILSRANFLSPSVVINGYLPAGGLFDPDEKLGLADFTASALMRGTTQRSFQDIYESLESVGASLGIGGGTHSTGFHGRGLAEDLGRLLELLAEVLRQPLFPPEQVERLRAQLLTGLAIRAQDTSDMASLAFDKIVYHDHPYSRPQDGYPETVSAITRQDLEDFHSHYFGPHGMVIAVVGGVDPQRAVEMVAQTFGDWRNPEQPIAPVVPPAPELAVTVKEKVMVPGKSQSDLIMGVAGPSRRSPDYMSAALGNSVLGQFGLMGRIGEAVRDKAGLAYYASSHLSGGTGPGPWFAAAGVAPENVEQAMDLIREEFRRVVSEPVAPEELSDSQDNFIGRLPLSLESNGGVAAALINLERYELGLDYYRHYPDLIRSVRVADVFETARRYLDPDRLGIAVAGPG